MVRGCTHGLDHQRLGIEASDQRGGAVLNHHLAVVHDGDLVTHLLGLFEVMGGQDHGQAALSVEASHVVPKHLAQFDIDARRGLIKDKNMGIMDQRLAEQKPSAHPPRQRARIGIGLVRQPHHFENLRRAPTGPGHTIEPGLHIQRAGGGKERIKVQFLRHHPDRSP